VTALGEELLRSPADSPAAASVWRSALQHLALTDSTDNTSHPYSILLRLVQARPGIDTPRLGLALEAIDDSEEEFRRILTLADEVDWAYALEVRGVSRHMQRNATKILPALARQLGDIVQSGGRNRLHAERVVVPSVGRRPRPVSPERIAPVPLPSGRVADVEDYADLALTAAQRLDRLRRHNRIVRWMAARLAATGYALYEDPFDTLATREQEASVLIEVKTLDGTGTDEIARVRGALAQLQYYERFAVADEQKVDGLVKVALFERPLTAEHAHFLEALQIVPAWFNADGELQTIPSSAERLAKLAIL